MLGGLRWLALCLVVLKAGSACMAQQVTATAKGLYLAPNDLGDVPDGALAQADNVVISKEGVVEARRGQSVISTKTLHRISPFEGRLVGHNSSGDSLSYSATDVASWTDYSGTFSEPLNGKVRTVSSQGNLYLTNSEGVKRIETATGSVYNAGIPKGLSPILALSSAGSPVVLANGYAVAYRVLWFRKTADGQEIVGEPSGRALIANSAGATRDIVVSIPIPPGMPTDALARVYRSPAVASTEQPSDELQLVYEGSPPTRQSATVTNITAGGTPTVTTGSAHGFTTAMRVLITNGRAFPDTVVGALPVVTVPLTTTFTVGSDLKGNGATSGVAIPVAWSITDILPETLLASTIYIAPSQGGIANANGLPPRSVDMASFRGAVFYAAASLRRYTVLLQYMAVTTGGEMDFSYSGGRYYKISASTAERFYLYDDGLANDNFNFKLFTAGSPSANVADTAASIVNVVNVTGLHSGALGVTGTLTAEYVSGPTSAPGIIAFSSDESFSVTSPLGLTFGGGTWIPEINNTVVAASNSVPANSIFWSKQDESDGVPALNYQRVGSAEYPIKRIIPTRDALFIFKDDGIWRLTGAGGVWDIQPLDPTVACPAPESLVAFENAVYGLFESGVGRVTESGVEILSGPIQAGLDPLLVPGMSSTLASVSFGINYDAAHKYILWLPSASTDTVATQAYVFDTWTAAWTRWLPPTGVTGFTHGIVNPADGRLYMVDGTSVYRERKAGDDTDFQDLTSTAIPAVVKYAPRFGGNPGQLHQFREASFIFRRVQFSAASVGFSTNLSPAEETIALSGADYGVNSAVGTQTTIRALVPREKSRASQLNVKFSHAQAGQGFQLQGVSVVFTPSSTRVSR